MLVLLILLYVISILSITPLAASEPSESVILGANSQSGGKTVSIVHGGTTVYMKLQFVESHVNRLRIVDENNRVFFDGVPYVNEVIYLPPAAYQATVWSSFGTSLDVAIRAAYTNEAARQTATPRPSTSIKPSQTQTPCAAPGYNQYNRYYYTNHPPQQTVAPTPHPTSVLDPNYQKQQNSVLSTPTRAHYAAPTGTKPSCPTPTKTKPH